MTKARITLLTRANCHLCDPARAALDRVAAATGTHWIERDIATDPELEYDYGDRIPVVLLDNTEHCFWRVEEERLIADVADPQPNPGKLGT